ncbi:hypothetical protein [Solibacillus sp. CAU 1738]|uniref:hypothetical protein n=1 Tax=Solibacillus sp. CAU 1738 TaxID=3140363 RepID=UPI0032601E76
MNWELSIEHDSIFVIKPELLNEFKLFVNEWNCCVLPLPLKYNAQKELQEFIFNFWLLNESNQHEGILDPYKCMEFSIEMMAVNIVNQNDLYKGCIDESSSEERFLFSYYFGFLFLEKLLALMNIEGKIEYILQLRHEYFEAKAQGKSIPQAEEFFQIQAFGTKLIVEQFKNNESLNCLILKALSQVKESQEKKQFNT